MAVRGIHQGSYSESMRDDVVIEANLVETLVTF